MNSIEFDQILDSAIKEGKIQLDDTQNGELQIMSQDPSRMWSLSEILFGNE